RSAFGRKAALSTLSILVALLIVGQAVTIYFVYQQSGQINKLAKTSQTLQLEALQRKRHLMVRDAHHCSVLAAALGACCQPSCCPFTFSLQDMAPPSNKTEDQVKHLLLQSDPGKMFPELKGNLMDNMKRLKNTMTDADWKSFESWMHKWLLFESAKNLEQEAPKVIPAAKATSCPSSADPAVELEEMSFSGVDMPKLSAVK
ncbi:HLA class II histocompatibility antigen gamma chain, partial [Apaloderma vittatum]